MCQYDWNSLTHYWFQRKCNEFYNSFPLAFCQGKNLKTLRNPWLTTGLLKYVKSKYRLYQLLLKRLLISVNQAIRPLKNKLTCLVRVARRNYCTSKLDITKSTLINKRVAKAPYTVSFSNHRVKISNPVDIANNLSDYITNIEPNLSRRIPERYSGFQVTEMTEWG